MLHKKSHKLLNWNDLSRYFCRNDLVKAKILFLGPKFILLYLHICFILKLTIEIDEYHKKIFHFNNLDHFNTYDGYRLATFSRYYWDRKIFHQLINPLNVSKINRLNDRDKIVYTIVQLSDEINFNGHERFCNCTNTCVLPMSIKWPCFWQKIVIRIFVDFYLDFSDPDLLYELTVLNTLNIHCLRPFNYPKNIKDKCLIDLLKQEGNFNTIFLDSYQYFSESLLLREDGFYLVNQFIEKLKSRSYQIIVKNYITKKLFKIWPPPLWYISVLKLREYLRNSKDFHEINYLESEIKRFVLNPKRDIANFNISSVLNFNYQSIWETESLSFGIMESLHLS